MTLTSLDTCKLPTLAKDLTFFTTFEKLNNELVCQNLVNL